MTDQSASSPADHGSAPDDHARRPRAVSEGAELPDGEHPPVVSTTDPEAQTDDPLIDPTNS